MQNRNLTAGNEKNSACDFFSHSGNFDAISCKKMREYREIAPENDPWSYKGTGHVILLAKLHDMYLYKTTTFPHQSLRSISKVAVLYRLYSSYMNDQLQVVVLKYQTYL